jgi:hypothetical protein
MMFDQQWIEAGALAGADGAHDQFTQDLLFIGGETAESGGRHGPE